MKVDEVLRVFVSGVPIPQGSKKIGGSGQLINDNDKPLKAWRKSMRTAVEVLHHGERIDADAIVVDVVFSMPRPATVRRPLPSVRPDVDKLLRAVLDALTEAAVWKDDGQVVTATASKVYTPDRPGALIRVGRVTPNKEERSN